MNRAALRQEIKDLGHNYGTAGWDARIDRFLNQGAKDVLLDELWPQRGRATITSISTAIPALGPIEMVVDARGAPLKPTLVAELRDAFPGPFPNGLPVYYYVTGNSGVSTWPNTTEQVTVLHFSRHCWIAADGVTLKIEADTDTDTLVGADVFEEAVLLAARIRVLEDTDENKLREELALRKDRVMEQLRENQLSLIFDEPAEIKQTRPWY